MTTRISVDVGGTFTDLVIYDSEIGELRAAKIPTTAEAPERGVVEAVRQVVPAHVLRKAAYFVHGTTVGLNALIERRGATVGLLATRGFRDVLEVRRGDRERMYDIFWCQPESLVPRRRRLPVTERVTASGSIHTCLREEDIENALEAFREEEVTSIAIAFLNAYVNPEHELRAEEILRGRGFEGEISASHRVSREYREYERTSTTVVDAFVRTRMARYLERLEEGLHRLGFCGALLCTRSGSGALTFAETAERPFETILSGPVGAATGAGQLARNRGWGDVITADVGGTSFDTALVVDGEPHLLHQGSVEGMPILSPWVDVRSIGAGGGSVAEPLHGVLKVGPRSAGAVPGPACYGQGGTEPTVTDAAAVLGMLGEGRLATGIGLDADVATLAVQQLGANLDLDTTTVAEGMLTLTAANMANAIREITIERGIDPQHMSLLAIGGAGPLLGCLLARQLDMTRIVVPPQAGNFSAWGLLSSEPTRSIARTNIMPVTSESLVQVDEVLQDLLTELHERSGVSTHDEDTIAESALDLRYVGQEHTLSLTLSLERARMASDPDDIIREFERSYRTIFGVSLEEPVEIVNVRAATRTYLGPPLQLPALPVGVGTPQSRETRKAYSFAAMGWRDFAVFDRSALRAGHTLPGPLIVMEDTATTYVDAGYELSVDAAGCLLLTSEG